jgi:DNA mismatch endonuclease (patch repair protein)
MADVFSPEKRSEIMSRIRAKNTKAEVIVFKYLREQKVYFQKHYTRTPGKPDIALPRKKKAVFIDGDFWHGRTLQRLIDRPGINREYWIPKIRRNMARDLETNAHYAKEDWNVLRVWESDLKRKQTRKETLERVRHFLLY